MLQPKVPCRMQEPARLHAGFNMHISLASNQNARHLQRAMMSRGRHMPSGRGLISKTFRTTSISFIQALPSQVAWVRRACSESKSIALTAKRFIIMSSFEGLVKRTHSESTAFTSRSTPSAEMVGQMKNCAKRSSASSKCGQLTVKWKFVSSAEVYAFVEPP